MLTSMGQAPESLDTLVRPHVDSFDNFLGEGLQTLVDLLEPVEVIHPPRRTASLLVRPFVSMCIAHS